LPGIRERGAQDNARLIIDAGQRAFTWTGPYGSGKSSLALALAAAVGSDSGLRKAARDLLGDAAAPVDQAFPPGDTGWLVVPVVGRRADPIDDLEVSLARALGKRLETPAASGVMVPAGP
jgi:energy-coupling factor transporter ATP-binding protein EcfA2